MREIMNQAYQGNLKVMVNLGELKIDIDMLQY